jgi:triosephosphate isomerase
MRTMSERKPIVIMNWSMRQNKNEEARFFAKELDKRLGEIENVEVVILPSMGTIYSISEELKESNIKIGAQTISQYQHGEYSGEYSIESLVDIGGKYVEIGHWERRLYFGETEEIINKKVHLALNNNIRPILCLGEKEKKVDIQEIDYHYIYIKLKRQIFNDLLDVNSEDFKNIVVAYTPQWAVGQSAAASRVHIHKVAKLIREILNEFYDEKFIREVQLVYGGTVSSQNAGWITSYEEIDGVLLGRFGSKPEQIIETIMEIEKVEVE